MKDIPLFTGSHGIASLILREIPYRREAYVHLRAAFDSQEALIRECESFCRMVGAEHTYVSGKGDFTGYPVYATLIERSIFCRNLPKTAARAVPTDEADTWLCLYRETFKAVPAANSCPEARGFYFIEQDGQRIGIGQIEGNCLRSVAALQTGKGADCVCAMAALCEGESLTLLCAEENLPAMRLYDKLGFSRGNVQEVWYHTK